MFQDVGKATQSDKVSSSGKGAAELDCRPKRKWDKYKWTVSHACGARLLQSMDEKRPAEPNISLEFLGGW